MMIIAAETTIEIIDAISSLSALLVMLALVAPLVLALRSARQTNRNLQRALDKFESPGEGVDELQRRFRS